MMEPPNDASGDPAGWSAFKAGAFPVPLNAWVNSVDAEVSAQVALRVSLPQRHWTGALDEVLAKIRVLLGARAYCSSNAERTNRMVAVVRRRLNRVDDPVADAAAIRGHLDAHGDRSWLSSGVVGLPEFNLDATRGKEESAILEFPAQGLAEHLREPGFLVGRGEGLAPHRRRAPARLLDSDFTKLLCGDLEARVVPVAA